jgi:hypothetical protein
MGDPNFYFTYCPKTLELLQRPSRRWDELWRLRRAIDVFAVSQDGRRARAELGREMGFAKNKWLEDQERGWDAPDKYVCAQCLEDDYLKVVVSENATEKQCDYCGCKAPTEVAAPLSAVLEPIAEALFENFADPSNAGLPRESGEWVGGESITDTRDALESLGLACNEKLFEDIAGSFINDGWYPCAHGHWVNLHEHEELGYAWDRFVNEVKYRSRYFFTRVLPRICGHI